MALNVFVALCYCNMDYYDVSLEILDAYLQVCHRHITSRTAEITFVAVKNLVCKAILAMGRA